MNTRNKLIRMADKSVAGWNIVDEYLTDELASDSDDEKRLRQAGARALRKKKAKSRRISTTSFKTSVPKTTYTQTVGHLIWVRPARPLHEILPRTTLAKEQHRRQLILELSMIKIFTSSLVISLILMVEMLNLRKVVTNNP